MARRKDRGRIERRTSQILDAAAHVFALKGFHGATIREIAAEAGVAEGTIYNYFANKESLLLAMIDRLAEIQQLSHLLEVTDDPPEVVLPQVLRDRFELLQRRRQIVQAVLPEVMARRELRERFITHLIQATAEPIQHYLQRQVDSGRLRPVNPQLAARMLQALIMGFVVAEITLGDASGPLQDKLLPDAVSQVLLHGLLPEGEPC
ncbi:MAG: TetR/AcrR family transcriptional regulator [Anaerolineae bacterium]